MNVKDAIATARSFIEQDESDAHWARGPQQRAEHQERADVLRALVEAVERRQSAYSDGYADGYARGQAGDPPYVEPSAVEDLGELEYGVIGPMGKMVNNGDYRVLQTHVRTKAGPWREIPKDQIVPVPGSRPS